MTQEELVDELFDTAKLWESHSSEFAMVPLKVIWNLEYKEDSGEKTLNQDQVDSVFGKPVKTDGVSKAVLVIDDAPFMRNMVSDILGSRGHRVWQAENGEAGLEDFRHHEESGNPFDLCLLDIRMPGMDGIETLKQIREQYLKDRVAMLSAASTRQNVETARDLGAAAFVVKPFQPERLMEKV